MNQISQKFLAPVFFILGWLSYGLAIQNLDSPVAEAQNLKGLPLTDTYFVAAAVLGALAITVYVICIGLSTRLKSESFPKFLLVGLGVVPVLAMAGFSAFIVSGLMHHSYMSIMAVVLFCISGGFALKVWWEDSYHLLARV